MPPHQITLRLSGERETYSCGLYSATHRTDALRRLCRIMAAAGMSGPAEVRDGDGKLRLTVAAVEEAAKWSLTEDDRGIRLKRYRPFNASKVKGGARKDVQAAAVLAAFRGRGPDVHLKMPEVRR